jgi:RNA polymerase sigma-54 factor
MPGHSEKPHSTLQLQTSQKQNVNLTQRLIMSAHMQQAIRLLQLPLLELEPFIEEQTVLNPLLEIGEITNEEDEAPVYEKEDNEQEIVINDKDLSILTRLDEEWSEHFSQNEPSSRHRSIDEDKLKTYLEQSIQQEKSLYDQLIQEAHDSFNTPEAFAIAEILIGYIDSLGFLTTPIHEICTLHQLKESDVRDTITKIQTFEPYGVGAATIQDSLLIQLRCLNKEHTLAYQIIANHYDNLIHNHIPIIQKSLKCSYQQIQEAIEQDIAKLDLHPGINFSSRSSHSIIPDATIREEEGELIVEVDTDYVPSLRVNHRYLKMLNDPEATSETKHFIKHHLFSARWLMRNLQQRYSTLERIVQTLAKRQREFFIKPDGQLVPLTMKTLANELNVHESTIARTVSNKYINSPRGIFSLRTFFTNKYVSEEGEDLSSSTVKQAISHLIKQENDNHPLSDEKISRLLKQKGISCARRTVAKYRSVLKIGNTQQRKKFN